MESRQFRQNVLPTFRSRPHQDRALHREDFSEERLRAGNVELLRAITARAANVRRQSR